jgi:hypothetical protein
VVAIHRRLIHSISRQRSDARRSVVRGVVRGPVDRRALEESVRVAVFAGDESGLPCCGERGDGAAVWDVVGVECGDGAEDCGEDVVDVVGEAEAGDVGVLEDLDADEGVGEEAFVVDGVRLGGVIEDAFEVGEDG